MNKFITATLFAAISGLCGVPQTARAGGHEVAAAIGGFIGGVIVGSAIDHDHHHARYDDHARVHVGAHIVIRDNRRFRDDHHRHGYWAWNRVRFWVPGRWIVGVDSCGRRIRHFERGHYEFRHERIWVSTGMGGRCDICR